MLITISNNLTLQNIPESLCEKIKDRLTFDNPKFIENQRMNRWNGNTPRELRFYELMDNGVLIIPRGFIRQLIGLCRENDFRVDIQDNRRVLPEVDIIFNGRLRPFQQTAVKDILSRNFGVLSSPTGSGKTCMALYCISQRKQPCLVICHSKELAYQWIDRANQFLGLHKDEIGLIGNGEMRLGKRLTIGIVNSVYKVAKEIKRSIGFLICDEAHRCPSRTFTEAVSAFDSRYMLGLSATPWRRDRLSRLIYWHLGDIVHEIEREDLIESGDILKAKVITRETDFDTDINASEEYSRVLSELTEDPVRNALIASDVTKEANNGGGICLVLSDRKAHCEAIKGLLSKQGVTSELLTGDLNKTQREGVVERLNNGRVKVLVATGQLIGEGFDCPGLSNLFLTTPIRFNGRVLQYLGRVLRPAPGKDKALVYDYIDSNVGVLRASAESRQRVYG